MTIIGFPDFQSLPQWRELNLLSAYSQVLNPGVNRSGALLVANWRGVQLRVGPSAGYCRANLTWYDDAAETQQVATDGFGVGTGLVLAAVIPAKGHYCDLNLNVTSPGAMTAQTSLMPTNSVTDRISYLASNNFLALSGHNVPLSTTQLIALPLVQSGPATLNWSFSDVGGNLALAVVRLKEDGTLGDVLTDLGSATVTTPFTQRVTLVDDSCGLRIINNDAAAAHVINVRLVPEAR